MSRWTITLGFLPFESNQKIQDDNGMIYEWNEEKEAWECENRLKEDPPRVVCHAFLKPITNEINNVHSCQ